MDFASFSEAAKLAKDNKELSLYIIYRGEFVRYHCNKIVIVTVLERLPPARSLIRETETIPV